MRESIDALRSGLRWYAARVRWGTEDRVALRLGDLGFAGYAPHYEQDGERVAPAFPAYVFCQFDMDRDGWQRINDDRHVVKLLPMQSAYPVDVPDEFIGWCRAREERGEFVIRPQRLMCKYLPGDRVPVIGGPLAGLHATFIEQARQNVRLLVSIFGRHSEATIPISQVQT